MATAAVPQMKDQPNLAKAPPQGEQSRTVALISWGPSRDVLARATSSWWVLAWVLVHPDAHGDALPLTSALPWWGSLPCAWVQRKARQRHRQGQKKRPPQEAPCS